MGKASYVSAFLENSGNAGFLQNHHIMATNDMRPLGNFDCTAGGTCLEASVTAKAEPITP